MKYVYIVLMIWESVVMIKKTYPITKKIIQFLIPAAIASENDRFSIQGFPQAFCLLNRIITEKNNGVTITTLILN